MTREQSPRPGDIRPERARHAGKSDKKRMPREFGGRKDGLEPTRYGDWEKNGRCIDF